MDERGTGISADNFDREWLHSAERRPGSQAVRSNRASSPLADHPVVANYRSAGGVSTEDLTSFIESFASLRANRVKSVGHEQYALATGQKFESFTTADTIRELLEELADASNYIDFLAIKLLNIQHVIDLVLPDCE
jgi:hypothetical protein